MRCFLLLRSLFSKNTAFMSIVDRHLMLGLTGAAPAMRKYKLNVIAASSAARLFGV